MVVGMGQIVKPGGQWLSQGKYQDTWKRLCWIHKWKRPPEGRKKAAMHPTRERVGLKQQSTKELGRIRKDSWKNWQ